MSDTVPPCECTEMWKLYVLPMYGHHQGLCGLAPEDTVRPPEQLTAALQAERERSLHLGEPWSVPDTLAKLADAADHLLKDHDCDAHGYEGVAAARDAARRMAARLATPAGRGDVDTKPTPEIGTRPLEAILLRVLDAGPGESILDAAKRCVDELIEWRGACEGAFGICTANPRRTLVALASSERQHHREHHERERKAWEKVRAIAQEAGQSEALEEAGMALQALDEQGLP